MNSLKHNISTRVGRSRATARDDFINSAVQQLDQAEALLKQYSAIRTKLALAVGLDESQCSSPSTHAKARNNKLDNQLDTFCKSISSVKKTWRKRTIPLSELEAKAQATLQLGQEYIDALKAEIQVASAHYRPFQRRLGH